jgi:WD40 repeat protein
MSFDAFLSYSRAADGKLAPALQSALHRFNKPWYKLRAVRIFRDQTTLAVTPELWPSIAKALDISHYLFLMASPGAAASQWVEREVLHWLQDPSRVSRLLLVLTEGEIAWRGDDFDWDRTTALPEALRGVFASEPGYVDLRWARTSEDLSLRNPRFADSVAGLAAPLHGLEKDQIIGEDVRQHWKTRLVAGTAAVAIVIAAALAGWQAHVARREAREALRQRTNAIARQLAARAELLWQQQGAQIEPSLLLAAESVRRSPGPEASRILLRGIELFPREARSWRLSASAADVSPKGDRVAVAVQEQKRIALFQVDTGKELSGIWAGLYPSLLRFSPDGSLLAAMGMDLSRIPPAYRVEAWDLASGRRILDRVYADTPEPGFTAGGRHLVVRWTRMIARDEFLPGFEVIDLQSGRALDPKDPGAIRLASEFPGLDEESRQAHALAAAFPALSQEISRERPPRLALSQNRELLALAGEQGVSVWDAARGEVLWRDTGSRAFWLHFSPSGRLVIESGSVNIRVREARSGLEVARLQPHGSGRFALSADEKWLVTWDFREGVRLWELSHRDGIWTLDPSIRGGSLLSLDGDTLLSGRSEEIRLWQVATGRELQRFAGTDAWDQSAVSADGTLVARAQPFRVRVWNARTRRELPSQEAGIISALGFGGSRLAIASGKPMTLAEPIVEVFDARRGSLVRRFRCEQRVRSLALSPTGRKLAVVSVKGRGWVRDVETGSLVVPLLAFQHPAAPVAFSPDETRLAVADGRGSVALLDLATGRTLQSLAHPAAVQDLSFSRDGKLLVTLGARTDGGSPDWESRRPGQTLAVWDLDQGRDLARIEADRFLRGVRFHRGHARLVTVGIDGTVSIFPWDPQTLRLEICKRLRRILSTLEWREGSGIPEEPPPTCPP